MIFAVYFGLCLIWAFWADYAKERTSPPTVLLVGLALWTVADWIV